MTKKATYALWVSTEGDWATSLITPATSYDLLRRGVGLRNTFDHVNARRQACEAVGVAHGRLDGWVDDEGLLKGLPVNAAALWLDGRPLVGPITITGGVDSEGETLGVSAKTLDALIKVLGLLPNRALPEWPKDGRKPLPGEIPYKGFGTVGDVLKAKEDRIHSDAAWRDLTIYRV